MKVAVIINPVSGASKTGSRLRELIPRLRRDGHQVERWPTTGPGDARRLGQMAAHQADAAVIVGGDGTVCEAADGLVGSTVPMVLWPAGTENLVARSLGFKADPETVSRCLSRGRTMTIDLGKANGRSFTVVAGVGFDAEVVERLTRLRTGHITHLSYFWPLWRTFWEHRWPRILVEAESPAGTIRWDGRGLVFVGNMARYALGLPVVRDARPDDGLLDLCILPCTNHVQLIGHSLRTLVKRHVERPGVLYERVTRLRATSPSLVPYEADGEAAGCLPLNIEIRPAAIRVKVPPAPPSR
ncbi:MAG TPA: diacylglycerol kinase family lipid kinase [Phycisphaerae bacterium]|nr:diacylglycerol kinase family lipid kinase [Phycisphaerae bacterium]HRY69312.1 diacylglycerol kinase family lipid kinase [Phycisphaerae bacterium]HSA26630.1 diacylglycerol kinase family lipid kinase [Phycisphaerae bacterium]